MNGMPTLSFVSVAAEAVICIAFPIVALLFWRKKKGVSIKPAFVGAGMFILFALILEGIINYVAFNVDSPLKNVLVGNVWARAAYGGLAAGVFEETSRLVGFKLLIKKTPKLQRKSAITYGIGHGGVEMALLVGVSMLANLALIVAFNVMGPDTFLSSYTPEQAESVSASINAISKITPYDCFWAVFERFCAFAIQISLSVIVFASICRKTKRYLFPVAILLHAIVDFPAGLYQTGTITSIVHVEFILAALACLMLIVAKKVYKTTCWEVAAA